MKKIKRNILILQTVYGNNFEIFKGYDEIYGLAARLGFKSAKKAWDKNPKYSIDLANNKLTKFK